MTTANDPKAQDGQDIIEGLAVNLKLSQQLLTALHEESVALRAMDTQGLFRLSRQKDTLLAKIHYLDVSLQVSITKEHKAPSTPNLTPEPTAADLSVCGGGGRFAAPWLRRRSVSGGCGSAFR